MKKASLVLFSFLAFSFSTFANDFSGKITIDGGNSSPEEIESFLQDHADDIQACTAKLPAGTKANIVFELNPGKKAKVRISGNMMGYRMKPAAKCLLGTSQSWKLDKAAYFTYSDNF